MRKFKRTMAVAAALFFSVTLLPTMDVGAAKKKLTVNRVYNTTTKVKGKTKKKYRVTVKIGKKTYKKTASKKGNYSMKIPKQSAGKSFYVRSYKKKGKKWKLYTKKKVYVLAKTASIRKFSKTAKNIQGYTRPKYTVKVTMNGKTYTKKASKVKGYFNIKLSKVAGNSTATVKIYNTKKKLWKTYKKKAYNATTSNSHQEEVKSEYTKDGKPYIGKMPGLTDPINVAEIERKANSTQTYTNHTIYCESDTTKNFYDLFSGYGLGKYGYVPYYMTDENYMKYECYTAKNGVTLYYNIGEVGKEYKSLSELKTPTINEYDGVIKSGQKGYFSPTFRDSDRKIPYLALKIVGYKNGKPVFFCSETHQLGAGIIGKPVVIK